jgi:hypothetical protein
VDGVGEAAFGALLHFAYADALPAATTAELLAAATGEAAIGARMEAAGDLIATADRYGMERMRLLCERALCEAVVDADTAAATLVLAVRMRCAQLKAFCVHYLASPGVLKAMMGTDAVTRTCRSRSSVRRFWSRSWRKSWPRSSWNRVVAMARRLLLLLTGVPIMARRRAHHCTLAVSVIRVFLAEGTLGQVFLSNRNRIRRTIK